ncbi:hypothetical protein HY285_04475 [Candidatus Peregrinibacteria bacterium]|nr:hypothetical protein [Candidatus Peregrinibacteria bacterium]MBI3816769.1 hypothetical protein [Candidatus Peregrinibacteria bacterium]
MDIAFLSPKRFLHTVGFAVLVSALVVAVTATLGRAMLNLSGAVSTDQQPDLSLFLLLQKKGEDIRQSTLLRTSETKRDYLVQTQRGPKIVELEKGSQRWYVKFEEALQEDRATTEGSR